MITRYPYQSLGQADHGWLKARHHFSFASYYNPNRMSFGKLRVVNDDLVEAGRGFAPHPHKDMEIITYVRTGEVTHQDNMGNKGTTQAGQVQTMSAGSGIIHSEYNLSDEPLTLYQIWIETQSSGIEPQWQTKDFPTEYSEHLPLLVSGYEQDKENALHINQQARIFGGKVKANIEFEHHITDQAYILASEGEFELIDENGVTVLNKGDGAEVTHIGSLKIKTRTDSEIVLIDSP